MLKHTTIILIFIYFVTVNAYHFRAKNWKPGRDLPEKRDLNEFLIPIETLMKSLENNRTIIDINYALGIFFTNVHLRRALMDKGQSVPVELRTRIKRIVDKNEKTLRYYHELRRNDTILMPRDYVIISNLFVYSLYWTYRLNKFYYEKQNSYSLKELEQIYKDWKTYSKNVDEVDMWSPNPGNSDMCLVTVAINPKNIGTKTISWCPIANICYKMLNEGTNFGYALCHRIIMLIMAQLGRGCALSSVQEDKQMMQKFCSMAYAEAEYIAMNDYGIPDLMLEIMCLCSMDGRVQFLRRSWLHKMFEFQTSTGCFGLVESNDEESHFYVCNSHTTSLASGTYAAAVRFILEEFY